MTLVIWSIILTSIDAVCNDCGVHYIPRTFRESRSHGVHDIPEIATSCLWLCGAIYLHLPDAGSVFVIEHAIKEMACGILCFRSKGGGGVLLNVVITSSASPIVILEETPVRSNPIFHGSRATKDSILLPSDGNLQELS